MGLRSWSWLRLRISLTWVYIGDSAVGCLLGRLPDPTRGGGRGPGPCLAQAETSWEFKYEFCLAVNIIFFPLPSLGASIFPNTF